MKRFGWTRAIPMQGADGAGGGQPGGAPGGDGKGTPPVGGGEWFGPLGADEGTSQIIKTKGWKNINDVAKGYAEAEKALGRGVVPPADNDPPEAWEKFHKRLGVPEKPEAYEIKFGEGVTPSESEKRFEAAMRPAFRKAGLTQRQVNILLADGYQPFAGQQREHVERATVESEKQLMGVLDQRWGSSKAANMALARRAASALVDPHADADLYNQLDKALGGSAGTMEVFYRMGRLMSESGASMKADGAPALALTPENAKREIDKMTNDPEIAKKLRTKSGEGYDAIRDKWNRLQHIVAGGEA